MTLDMYDGINVLAAGIHHDFPRVTKVAGYIDGRYRWTREEWDLFPHADHVHISVRAANDAGDVLDVEIGDATPEQTRGWIEKRKAAGLYRPTIYCSYSTVPAVRAATGSYVLSVDYDIWVAKYDGTKTAPPMVGPGNLAARFAAKQWKSTPRWDANAVYDTAWPHRHRPASA